MTATEKLRELLDERGVEWTKPKRIWWELIDCEPDDSVTIVEGVTIEAATDGTLVVYPLTPEQAIAATLGSCNCTNSERTDAPRLPHFWTHDGTLHVELPKLPDSISVRLPDQRDREVSSARTWQYALENDGVGRTDDGLADLQAENAKLRELCEDMWPHVRHRSRMCGECELPCDTSDECLLYEPMRQRMRELGVEVKP